LFATPDGRKRPSSAAALIVHAPLMRARYAMLREDFAASAIAGACSDKVLRDIAHASSR